MGGGISVDLRKDGTPWCSRHEQELSETDLLRGELVLINKGKKTVKLSRFARVYLQLRAVGFVKTRDGIEQKFSHEVWRVGDDTLVPRGTSLQPGENSFKFSYPIDGKLREPLKPPEHWVEIYGRFLYMKYEFVLRAGAPPATKDIVLYPELLTDSVGYMVRGNQVYNSAAAAMCAGAALSLDVLELANAVVGL